MITSPAAAKSAIEAITEAMRRVGELEINDDNLGGATYQLLVDARRTLATYVSDEWDKSRTMECGAD
jgi:hypothetical protein